jgi:uncharacterized sporulation protein YeaH/YhbH (DUF444 family)
MPQLIDRRLNPRDKSLGNRQRFLRRTREQIKQAVDKAVRERGIADAAKGGSVSIPGGGISEPQFQLSNTGGNRQRVFPGNKKFVAGDEIPRPEGGSGGGAGSKGSDSGGGEDAFTFALSEAEFLDILFDDLELPDLVKATLKDETTVEYRRAGFSNEGAAANLNVLRTMRTSMSRRLAMRRPKGSEIARLEAELDALREGAFDVETLKREVELFLEIEKCKRIQRAIPFIDPIDVRYNRFEPKPIPRAKAVMFCLMDVSASMGEREKDLAKRFFILLHLFLKRKYERVELVFIRHTHEAGEVDEETFFYGRETGGTVVSTALKKALEILEKRYPISDWNVYCAQASDGDNSSGDTELCVELLAEKILPLTQYYAYIEIGDRTRDESPDSYVYAKDLWRGYAELAKSAANFAMRHVSDRAHVYPVFRQLFAKHKAERAVS